MDKPRNTARRKADTLARLASDVDCWVPSASADGDAYLIPLSFVWYEDQIIMATLAKSLTVRHLTRAGRGRIALDGTRDVVLIEGQVDIVAKEALATPLSEAFATAAGFDPRRSVNDYVYLVLKPRGIRAWREENELMDREIMRDGRWLA